MSRLSRALVALLFVGLGLALPACDSGTDNPGVGSLDGYTGNPDLLGVWQRLDETSEGGNPMAYDAFAVFSYSEADREVSLLEWSRESGDTCWSRESEPVSAVTRTRMTVYGGSRLYTIGDDRLSIYERSDDTDLDDLFRRSSRATTSFTPVCP